jgi:hypothetical protein
MEQRDDDAASAAAGCGSAVRATMARLNVTTTAAAAAVFLAGMGDPPG